MENKTRDKLASVLRRKKAQLDSDILKAEAERQRIVDELNPLLDELKRVKLERDSLNISLQSLRNKVTSKQSRVNDSILELRQIDSSKKSRFDEATQRVESIVSNLRSVVDELDGYTDRLDPRLFMDAKKKKTPSSSSPNPDKISGLYLVEPHPRYMWEGKKTVIIKSKKYDLLGKQFFLVDKDKCYGVIKIRKVYEIDDKKYKRLAPKHKITAKEKADWGKKYPSWRKAPYYEYKFSWVNKFKEPKKIKVPKGTQHIVSAGRVRFIDCLTELPCAEDFCECVWIPKFISFTGSALYGSEPMDLDIVVKAKEIDGEYYIKLDKDLRLKVDRVGEKIFGSLPTDWICELKGPNWTSLPGWDLVLRPRNNVELDVIEEPDFASQYYGDAKGISLFKFVPVLKPLAGRHKQEEYSIDSTIRVVESMRNADWYKKGIYVERKFDGDCVSVHSDGNGKVTIFSSEGNLLEDKLPTLTSSLKRIGNSFVLSGEIEHWSGGKHSPRQKTTAIIHSKDVDPEEKGVVLNVFDILFIDGKDIHSKPFSERVKSLSKIPESSNIKKSDRRLVNDASSLKNAMEHYSKQEGAEGSYLKLSDFKYELDGTTRFNIKHKNTTSIDAKVKSVHDVEGSDTWNYLTTLEDGTPLGNTYNTSVKASVGDVITVEFVNLNKYTDPDTGKVWYNFWSPRVVAKRDKSTADSKDTAEKLVEFTDGNVSEKSYPKRYLDAGQGYLKSPDEDKKWLGMLQFDCRKKNVGIDFRWQVSEDEIAAFTVFVPKGLSKVPENPNDAKTVLNDEIIPLVKDTLGDPQKKFNCQPKDNINAGKDAFEEIVGYGPGYDKQRFMWTWDSFDLEHGAKKEDYVELFCDNDFLKGRLVFVKIKNKDSWKKTPEGEYTWMMFLTKEQTPYVVSSRAVTKRWVPPYGKSCLPEEMRSKVPENLQYWKKKDESERRSLRNELVEKIKKKEVVLDSKTPIESFYEEKSRRADEITRLINRNAERKTTNKG